MRNPIRRKSAEASAPQPARKDPNGRIPGEQFAVFFVMTGAVIAILLAFGFDFGNVWALAARLGVPSKVQPLTAPAVTISYLAIMVGQQYLALRGWTNRELVKARLWLLLIGAMTYALNCGDAFMRGAYGEGLFDMVMPTLLLMWGELAPWIMRQVHMARERAAEAFAVVEEPAAPTGPTLGELGRMVEELRAELTSRDEESEEPRARTGRRESPLRPTCREFVWKWLEAGRTYDNHPAAAWRKALVAEMGDDAPTIERCRQIMRDEYWVIERQFVAAREATENADQVIEDMEGCLSE